MGALFSESAEWGPERIPQKARGPREIAELARSIVPLPDEGPKRRHLTTNIVIRLEGDTARVKSNFLMVRESPLHLGHLRTLTQLAEMGAIIAPPMPAFYSHPASLDEMVDHTVGRMLDLFDIDSGLVRRWGEDSAPNSKRGRMPVRAKAR